MQGREIKFRAWDGSKLISVVYPKSNYKFEVDWDGKFKLHTFHERQEITDEHGETWKQPIWETVENAIIMQFTGLRDKNGKEIYEGDVVRVKNGAAVEEAPEYIRAEIIWGEGYFDFNHKHIPEFDSDDYSTYYFIYPPFSYKAEELEVIGNIYENPELLEVEK